MVDIVINFDEDKIPVEGSSSFREDAGYIVNRLPKVVKSMNSSVAGMNQIVSTINTDASSAKEAREKAIDSANKAKDSEANTLSSEARVKALVPLDGVGYSTDKIDSIVGSIVGATADGISGFVDKELDLEISETNAVVGIKNRYAKFGDEIVDLYGPELVTNGDFSDGTTGWITNGNGNGTVTDAKLKTLVKVDKSDAYSYQVITTEVGKQYRINANLYIGDSLTVRMQCSEISYYDSNIYNSGNLTINKDLDVVITAKSDTTYVSFHAVGAYKYIEIDNISVREIKSIDLADTVPNVQTIGSTPLVVTDGSITDTDVAKDAVIGTDAIVPAHNNGHQTKITARVKATTDGIEVQVLDKSNSDAVIRTQTVRGTDAQTIEFWVSANADGYLVHAIKRENDGSGDESIVVSAKGFEDLVTTDVVESSDYCVIDKEEMVVNGTFDVDTTGWSNADGNLTLSIENGRLKIVNNSESSQDCRQLLLEDFASGAKSIIRCDSVVGCVLFFDENGGTTISVPPRSSQFISTFTSSGVSPKIIIRVEDGDTAYVDNVSWVSVSDTFRNESQEAIPTATSVYDSRFSTRDYISNQQLVTLKQDVNGVVTTASECLMVDSAADTTQRDTLINNGFSEVETGLFAKNNDKYIPVGIYQN